MATIDQLHKNDKFIFNDKVYTVSRKWISDEKPLIAYCDNGEERFYFEGLEIEKLDPTNVHFKLKTMTPSKEELAKFLEYIMAVKCDEYGALQIVNIREGEDGIYEAIEEYFNTLN